MSSIFKEGGLKKKRKKIPIPMDFFALKEWFKEHKREFPWRKHPTPYAVWVSEVMLQQTQAAVVVDYFEKWMYRFPTLTALAKASLEEVLKTWEGLGYYARARSLYAGAKKIESDYGGELPTRREELAKISGLGPYTIGAILSFGFHQRAAAVDGNVMRVMARYYLIEEEINRSHVQKMIRNSVEQILPQDEPWVAMEALIELGAKSCRKVPDCFLCPIREGCGAFLEGKQTDFPKKKAAPAISVLVRQLAIILWDDGEVLLKREEEKKLMAGLYQFPTFEGDPREGIHNSFGTEVNFVRALAEVQHSYTRFRVRLFPSIWQAAEKVACKGFYWHPVHTLSALPFCSGHRTIAAEILT